MKNKKIVVIDDDADFSEALNIFLKSKEYQVFLASDYESGIRLVRERMPNLIILDVRLTQTGKFEGFDFASEIRDYKNLSWIPILMYTSINQVYQDFNYYPGHYGKENKVPVDYFAEKTVLFEDVHLKIEELLQLGISKWAKAK